MPRKLFFWLHLSTGLAAGLVILVLSATGVLLAFERQIVAAAEARFRVTPGADILPLSAIVAAASAAHPSGEPSGITIQSDPTAPATVSFGRDALLLVDPWSGAVLGPGAERTRGFFRGVENLHRWLALPAEGRDVGRAVTGACNLGFLFLVMSGLYLWIPRRTGRGTFRSIMWFRRGARGRARDFNWHNVFGFWMAIPLAVVVATAAVISYPWANALVYRLAGSEPPARRAARAAGDEAANRAPLTATADSSFALALAHAERVAPAWRSARVRLPLPADGTLTLAIDESDGGRPDRRSEIRIGPGSAVSWENYASQETARKVRSWIRWIHTGEAGGIAGQAIAALASLAGVMLVWTGLSLALRRFRSWLRRPAADGSPSETMIPTAGD